MKKPKDHKEVPHKYVLTGSTKSGDIDLCECDKCSEAFDHKKAMEYASCVDTQSHLKKCKKCRAELVKETLDKIKLENYFTGLGSEYNKGRFDGRQEAIKDLNDLKKSI